MSVNPFLYRADLFTRENMITLKNYTSSNWTLKKINEIGGHFDYKSPPKEIRSMSTGGFMTSNSGLGYVQGPEGYITYSAVIRGVPTDITLYYMHPVTANKSIYTITTNPPNMVNWDLDPQNPTGWSQVVFVNVYDIVE